MLDGNVLILVHDDLEGWGFHNCFVTEDAGRDIYILQLDDVLVRHIAGTGHRFFLRFEGFTAV